MWTVQKKPVPRPAAGLVKAMNFNHTVATNLWQLGEKSWYLDFIDEFSRFSNATIIKSKDPNLIIKMFLKYWISLFGTQKNVFSDNGGEYVSTHFENCEAAILKNFAEVIGKQLWSNSFSEKLQPATLKWKDSIMGFPCEFWIPSSK